MILAENVLICKCRMIKTRETFKETQSELTRMINEFMPEVKRLMDYYVKEHNSDVFESSRVIVIAHKSGGVKIGPPKKK